MSVLVIEANEEAVLDLLRLEMPIRWLAGFALTKSLPAIEALYRIRDRKWPASPKRRLLAAAHIRLLKREAERVSGRRCA